MSRSNRQKRIDKTQRDAGWLEHAETLIPLLIIAAVLSAYWGSFSGAFIFDDMSSIRDNPSIRELWPLWKAMSPPPQRAAAGRPVVNLSLAINYAFGGLEVWGFHAVNLAVHISVALLLFGIARRTLTGSHPWRRKPREASWLAGAAALIWAVHPLVTESVTYIIQRTELLMGLFFLLTLYLVILGTAAPKPAPWYAAAAATCAMGMGSKEVMAAAPVVVLLYDRIFLARSWMALFRLRWALYGGLVATSLILGYLVASGPRSATAGLSVASVTPVEYAFTQCGVILHYLRLAFWPYPLCIDYFDWPVARSLSNALPQVALVFMLLATTIRCFVTRPWLGFLGAWFFLILAPTSSIVPIVTELAAERRMYLPLMAVVLLIVLVAYELLFRFSGEKTAQRIGLIILAALVPLLGYATAQRNLAYRSESVILGDAVAHHPKNVRARNNLGSALAREGRIPEAIEQFNQALAIFPKYPEALNNLGAALYTQGRYKAAAALISDSLRLKPDYEEAHLNLGLALHSQGEIREAILHYTEAIRLDPGDAEAHNHLGAALLSLGQANEAIGHFRRAVGLRPDYVEARRNLNAALSHR